MYTAREAWFTWPYRRNKQKREGRASLRSALAPPAQAYTGPATPNGSRPSRVWPGHEPSPFLACTPRPARVLRHINPEAKSPVTCRSIAGPRPSRSPRPRTSLLLASLRAPCPLEHSAAARKPSAQVFPADPPSRIPSQPVLLRVGAESPGLQRSGLLLEPYTSPSVMALGNHEHKGPARNILSHSFPAIGEYVQSFPLISFFSRLYALVPSLHPKHHHQKPRLCADQKPSPSRPWASLPDQIPGTTMHRSKL